MGDSCCFTFEPAAETVARVPASLAGWTCPHEAHPDEERCVFHLPPAERSELGIDDETVLTAFLERALGSGERAKQFVGARLGTLDLQRRVLAADDRYPIDLRYATVGELDLRHAVVSQPLRLSGAEVGTVACSEATLEAGFEFVGGRCAGAVDGTAVTFEADVDWRRATFEGTVTLDESRFEGDSAVGGAQFCDDVWFRGAEFHGETNHLGDDISFEAAAFDGRAVFTNAEFEHADFCAVTFREGVSFTGATFDSEGEFDAARFAGAAEFDEARLAGGTFVDATFEASLTFDATEFDRDAVFSDATFAGDASFREVRFREDIDFEQATFETRVTFLGTEVDGGDNVVDEDACFRDVTFGAAAFDTVQFRYATFEGATFEGDASFEETTFDEDGVFTAATFLEPATFLECRFRDDAAFDEASFEAAATFDGVEFHGGANTKDEDATFADATFDERVSFERARFRAAEFAGATFGGDTEFESVVFDRTATFDDCIFEGEPRFDECRFRGDADFVGVVFETDVRFHGVEFQGKSRILTGDVSFRDAVFGGTTGFERAKFGFAVFEGATFQKSASFVDATFTDNAVFDDARFRGNAMFERAVFVASTAFESVVFDGVAEFSEAEFRDNVDFHGTTFAGTTTFEGVSFDGSETVVEDDSSFRDVLFEDDVTFARTRFRFANFTDATFAGRADFCEAKHEAGARFVDVDVAGFFDARDAQYNGTVTVERTAFHSPCDFTRATFGGDTTLNRSTVSFVDTVFDEVVSFVDTTFGHLEFDDTAFNRGATFVESTFEEPFEFAVSPVGAQTIVDMAGVSFADGTITQPDDGAVFYDMEEAVLRDVSLEASANGSGEHPLFDYFRFCHTEFEDFDFSQHNEELAGTDWTIHEFAFDSAATAETPRATDGGEQIPEPELDGGSIESPSDLESTYLKAKNSADAFGHRKAAAEFFIKELTFRRQKNIDAFRQGGGEVRNRLKAGGKALGNWVLYQTCGYGERLWRVVYVSSVFVLMWGVFYTLFSEGTTGAVEAESVASPLALFTPNGAVTLGKNVYFSIVTFTTLGYGDVQPVGTIARTLAGIESFIGALLVALVVFVLGRRVAR
jgi:uncharacterized protein YjbI with pentapeptide repeats